MKKRIFIVDDSPPVWLGLSLLINNEKDLMVCGTAETGGQALKDISSCKPDLVIVDITLPDMNGIDLIQPIRQLVPDAAVLIVTMHDSSVYTQEAFNAGAKGYITKKDAATTIIPTIRHILDGKK